MLHALPRDGNPQDAGRALAATLREVVSDLGTTINALEGNDLDDTPTTLNTAIAQLERVRREFLERIGEAAEAEIESVMPIGPIVRITPPAATRSALAAQLRTMEVFDSEVAYTFRLFAQCVGLDLEGGANA